MPSIHSYIPSQISMGRATSEISSSVVYEPGIYAKVEGVQLNTSFSPTHTHMPFPYLPDSTSGTHVNSIFGELDRKMWMKGILLPLEWGNIETSDGVYDWTFIDFVFDTIRGLPKTTGQNKKVIFLIQLRRISLTGLNEFLPTYLRTQPATNGGYYLNTTTYPPGNTNPVVNAKKYDNAWCYIGLLPGTSFSEPKGYNLNLYKFAAAAGTNMLKTKFYAFLDAIVAKYGSDEVFAGVLTTESALGAPFVAFESGDSNAASYEGRKNIHKQMRATFPNHLVADAANFDEKYYMDMTGPSAIDGLVANHIAFTTPNLHLGTNMNLYNTNTVLKGKVPIVMQSQGLDMRSKTGNRPKYYNWPTNPAQILSGDGISDNDPSTCQFQFDRAKYYNANYFIIQRNTNAGGLGDWSAWKPFMDSGPYANDPLGGMDGTVPLFVV